MYSDAEQNYLNNSAIDIEEGMAFMYLPTDKDNASMIFDMQLEITTVTNITVCKKKSLFLSVNAIKAAA